MFMEYCGKCGVQIGEESYCGNCGSKIARDTTPPPQSKIMDVSAAKPVPIEQSSFSPSKPKYDQPTYPQPMAPISQPNYAPMLSMMPPERSYLKWFGLIFGSVFLGIVSFFIGMASLLASAFGGSFGGLLFLFFLGIVLIGIGGISQLIYSYHNFNDFRVLNRATHGWPDNSLEPAFGLILYIFIFPIAIYVKEHVRWT